MMVDLVLMRCDRQQVTLSTTACSRMWRSAADPTNLPRPWESRRHCLGCRIGAENAGVSGDAAGFIAAKAALASTCARCGASGRRIIGARDLCISCYNRQREAERGRNAKGSRPRLCDKLFIPRVAVDRDGAVRIVEGAPSVSLAEFMIRVARRAEAPTYFGPAPWKP